MSRGKKTPRKPKGIETGALSCRDALYDGSHGSSPLGHTPATTADDFKTGFRLVVGELESDRNQNVGKARRRSGDLPTPDSPQGTRTIARPVEQPARMGGVPKPEHIGFGGVNGYPAPTYLEQNGWCRAWT